MKRGFEHAIEKRDCRAEETRCREEGRVWWTGRGQGKCRSCSGGDGGGSSGGGGGRLIAAAGV